jgi:hypothetical protein
MCCAVYSVIPPAFGLDASLETHSTVFLSALGLYHYASSSWKKERPRRAVTTLKLAHSVKLRGAIHIP